MGKVRLICKYCTVFCKFEDKISAPLKRIILWNIFFNCFLPGTFFAQSWLQGFENVDSLFANGWAQQNNSDPAGTGLWRKDNGNFTAQNGTPTSSIICDYTSIGGSGVGNISNWLFTPVQNFQTGDTLFFWTRSYANLYYPDRLEVRISNNGASTDVGSDEFSVGVFSTLLLTINPNLDTSLAYGYPLSWKQFAVPIPSLYNGTSGRIAFRYFVTDGGENGINGSTIGIDNMHYKSVNNVSTTAEQPQIWWQVYPNPSSGIVTITVNQSLLYTLYSTDGKKVSNGKLVTGQNLVDFSSLPRGIYLMEIVLPTTRQRLVRKIQVQ